jgi:hypothetical protein
VDSSDLFVSEDGRPYARVPSGGHYETWPLNSRGFRNWVARRFFQFEAKVPGGQALQDALGVLSGKAQFEGPTLRVHTRLAMLDGRIYLDLANDAWEAVEVTAEGWSIVARPPVKFRRPRGLLPIPTPRRGGDIGELRDFVNVPSGLETTWRLLAGWLVGALRPVGPYPVLVLHGEQGSAKSTTARLLRSLIDPSAAPLRSVPKDERDLMIAANANWIIALDNVSHLSPAFSDALCRLSSGGGLATRELYRDEDEVIFQAQRPVIVNGIEEIATREDLLDRAIILYLPPIPPGGRRLESELWAEFERTRPRILGALLDALVAGLRNLPSTYLSHLPRMADFAVWVSAVESALGWPAESFLKAYDKSREAANDLVLESSLFAHPLLELVAQRGTLEATASELLRELSGRVDEGTARQRSWPSNGRALSGALRRLAATLRNLGLRVEFLPRRGRARLIRLDYLGAPPSSASPPSPPEASAQVPAAPPCGSNGRSDGHDARAPSHSSDLGSRIEEVCG